MVVKTITVTERAYGLLKAKKAGNESFSDVILRIAGGRSLRDFAGMLSNGEAAELERAVNEARMLRNAARKRRMKQTVEAFGE